MPPFKIRLTREVRVRLTPDVDAFAQRTANSWSGWPDVKNIVPVILVRGTVEGEVDAKTGYVCDVKEIDTAIRSAVMACANQGIVDWSHTRLTNGLFQYLTLESQIPVPIVEIEIAYSPYLRLRRSKENRDMVTLTQQYEFSAAHRLHCPKMSDDENRELFGKCNNPNGHGHNYVFDVEIKCSVETSGRALALDKIDQTVKSLVVDRFDHKHLNEDSEEFRSQNPTVENIATVIFKLLKGRFEPARLSLVRVYETPKTWAEYRE